MRLVIVGGGKVGAHLGKEMAKAGNAVVVIEANPEKALAVSEESEVVVFEGDGTDIEILRAADTHRADWLLAVTGRDEDNIVACQLGTMLGVKRVLARLNNPRNRPTFDALGVPVVSVTDLMAKVITREVEVPDLSQVALLGGGVVSIVELEVPQDFEPRPVSGLDLPGPAVLVLVTRGGQSFVPRGATMIEPGDRIVAVTAVDQVHELRRVFLESGGGA